MVSCCKDFDLTKIDSYNQPIFAALCKRWKRGDTIRYLSELSGMPRRWIEERTIPKRRHELFYMADLAAQQLHEEVIKKSLRLRPIKYKLRFDESSRKTREIAIEDIKQQLLDAVADEGLKPLMRRVGEYQVACIKGRGNRLGSRAIRRWMRDKGIRYAVQADIKQCYPSVDKDKLMTYLRKHIRNRLLLWLIGALIATHKQGLDIGCVLSKDLMNILLSDLYHHIMERMYHVRRGKRTRACKHLLFQMDDILGLCTAYKFARELVRCIITELGKLCLTVKKTWRIIRLDRVERKGRVFVDILGIRFYRRAVSVRRTTFLRIRRAYLRAKKAIQTHKELPLWLARRIVSYWGILNQVNNTKTMRKLKARMVFVTSKGVIRSYAHQSRFHGNPAVCAG